MNNANRSETDVSGPAKPAIDMSAQAIGERLNKTWQLTIEKWAANGIDISKLPMRKDVERLIRLKDK